MGGAKRRRGATAEDPETPGDQDGALLPSGTEEAGPAPKALRRSERVRSRAEAAALGAAAAAAAAAAEPAPEVSDEHTPEPEAAEPDAPVTPQPPKEKRPWNRRICTAHAMARYGLTRRELDELRDVQLRPNPYYRSAAPMRMYLQREVKALHEKKQERLRYEAAHAEETAAAREEEARRRREAAKQAARAKVEPLKRPAAGDTVPAGNTPLPQELWAVVFQRLAATLEPQGGVRGPSVVAEDIVRAGLACRDMFIASRAGLEALAEEVVAKRHLDMQRPPLPVAAPVVDWARWDKALRTPLDCLVPELKSACKDVGTTCSGTKAELVVRLMNHFGLPDGRRCPVSAKLWVALRQEHAQYGHHNGVLTPLLGSALRDLLEVGDAAAARALQYGSLSAFRRRVAAAYGDTAGVMAAHLACLPRLGEIRAERARRAEEERRASEERRRQQYELWQREAEARRGRPQVAANGQLMCACGQMVSAACSLRLCGGCCKRAAKAVPCPKHG